MGIENKGLVLQPVLFHVFPETNILFIFLWNIIIPILLNELKYYLIYIRKFHDAGDYAPGSPFAIVFDAIIFTDLMKFALRLVTQKLAFIEAYDIILFIKFKILVF